MLCIENGMMLVPRAWWPSVRSRIQASRAATCASISSVDGTSWPPPRSEPIQTALISAESGEKNEEL